jgi:iron complex outermembrane receptor protein
VGPLSTQELQDSCQALGVPIDGSYAQLNTQISVLTGGNVALDPETSTSLTWGAVYDPDWANSLPVTESLSVSVDVYDYTIEGNIGAIDAQSQLEGCVTPLNSTIDPNLCAGITRTGTGSIVSFDNFLKNLGSIDTKGYDLNFVWRLEETALGSIKVSWNNSFVSEFVTTDVVGTTVVVTELAGIERTDSAIPEWTSNLIVDWALSKWTGSWSIRMIDGVTEACTDDFANSPDSLANLGLCSDPDPNGDLDDSDSLNRLGTTVYHDVQVGYEIGDLGGMDTTVKVGINNLFDHDPPICMSCSLNGYDASTYDMPGSRFVYVALVGRFD